jgi:hypothetical protein
LNKKLQLFDKNTPLFKIFAKFRYFSAIFCLFCTLTFNLKSQFSHISTGFSLQISVKTKFRYFYATFGQNDSGTASKTYLLLEEKFR